MVVQESKQSSLLLSLKPTNGSFSSSNSSSTTNSLSSTCLSVKRKYSTKLSLLRRKYSTVKRKLNRNSPNVNQRDMNIREYDSDEITIVARDSHEKLQTVNHIDDGYTERISLDELEDSTLRAVCCQVMDEKKPFYYEWIAHIDGIEFAPITIEELPLPPEIDDSFVKSWEKYCQEYDPPVVTIKQPSPPPLEAPPSPPPKYQPRNIPSSIKYKSQLNDYLKESSRPYSSLSSYYLNLHNSFSKYHLIVQDGSYQCSNYEMLQPMLEEDNKSTKLHRQYFYYTLLFYISFALVRNLI